MEYVSVKQVLKEMIGEIVLICVKMESGMDLIVRLVKLECLLEKI